MLKVKSVSKSIQIGKNKVDILKNIDLEIKQGEIVAICGRSGSGKSTLLGVMSGIDKPTSGRVLFHGNEIYSQSESKQAQLRNENFGIIFQDYQLLPELSVMENIEVPLLLSKKSTLKRKDLLEILKKVEMQDSAHKKVSLLSGGEKQRVAIARAIAQQPEVIFADEPTGALDQESSLAVMKLLLMIRKEYGTSIVLVTHDTGIAKVADRKITLNYGTVYGIEGK